MSKASEDHGKVRRGKKSGPGWRARLRSEVWRHLIAVVGSAVLAGSLNVVLMLTGAITPADPGNFFDLDVMAPGALAVFAIYGPVYLWLSKFAWRGLSGLHFRKELRSAAPPSNGLVRDLLLSNPTQISGSAALLSLAAVYVVAIRPGAPMSILLISLACVCGSWILVMASFSMDYAREWANSNSFRFPGDDDLTYSDFLYLAVQVSTTYSSSDVMVMNRRARRLVTIQSLTAFIFATVILALLVALVLNALAS